MINKEKFRNKKDFNKMIIRKEINTMTNLNQTNRIKILIVIINMINQTENTMTITTKKLIKSMMVSKGNNMIEIKMINLVIPIKIRLIKGMMGIKGNKKRNIAIIMII